MKPLTEKIKKPIYRGHRCLVPCVPVKDVALAVEEFKKEIDKNIIPTLDSANMKLIVDKIFGDLT